MFKLKVLQISRALSLSLSPLWRCSFFLYHSCYSNVGFFLLSYLGPLGSGFFLPWTVAYKLPPVVSWGFVRLSSLVLLFSGTTVFHCFLTNVWKPLFYVFCLNGLLPMVYEWLLCGSHISLCSKLFYSESPKCIFTIHLFFTLLLKNYVRPWGNGWVRQLLSQRATWACGKQTFKIIIWLYGYNVHMPAIIRWIKCHGKPEGEEINHNWNGLGAGRNR